MKRCLWGIWIALFCLCASAQNHSQASDLFFSSSDLTGVLRTSAEEMRRSPHAVEAHFVHMEAARLELRNRDELRSAIAVLRDTRGADPRAEIAASRIRELAANTPQFRAVLPDIAELLAKSTSHTVTLSDAVLKAAADGATLPGHIHLARRITKWQIAGPFGQFANVDFDRAWPPEEDDLLNTRYEQRIREEIEVGSGELELPEYFSRSGIYYAAAQLSISQEKQYRFTIECDGTYQLRIDKIPVLIHDARFSQQSATSTVEAQIAPGQHRILVKLQASSLPLRIWIEPVREDRPAPLRISAPEESYLKAASALLNGDPRPALAFDDSSPTPMQTLKAEALLQTNQQARELLKTIAASNAGNLFAAFKVAEEAFSSEQYDDAIAQLARVLNGAPAYPQAQELKFQAAEHFNWQIEKEASLIQRLRLHPSCAALTDAITFYESGYELERATHYQQLLATCSPNSFQFWEQLSLKGKHEQAISSIRKYISEHPNDRKALIAAIREAVLGNDFSAAASYAQLLHTVASNWKWATSLADRPELILDSRSSYSAANGFYKPFVRDPLAGMRDSGAESSDSRVLINDRVVKLDPSGAWIYQHTVTQALNKKGITELGEVEVPKAVDVLELRTIKGNGMFVEAEANDSKNPVSMPSLAEGDAIEIAYLKHVSSDVLAVSPQDLDFAFASSQSPTRSARLTLIRDHTSEPLLWRSPEVRCIHSEPGDNFSITTWEVANAPAIQDEPAAPQYERRPRVLFLSMDRNQFSDTRTRIRDSLIGATKISFPIQRLASELQSSSAFTINTAYNYVMQNVEDELENWREGNITSADESLQQGEGSRAATLIALLSAMGYETDLVLASERGKHDPGENCPDASCYTHPLVRVTMPDSSEILLDPKAKGIAAGSLSPEVEGETAVIVSRNRNSLQPSFVIPQSTDQRSEATAALSIDEIGGLEGTMRIRFGSFRSGQMRQMLLTLSSRDREGFLEQVADRILPGAKAVSTTIRNEDDLEKQLELELTIRAPKFGRWNGPELQLQQLVPPLGLSRTYAMLPQRQQPVLLDTPLVENSEFVINLPPGLEAARTPATIDLNSEFGEYHSESNSEGTVLKLTRRFRIPAQVIAPARYRDFSDFALQVDTAEKQPIQLRRPVMVQMLPSSSANTHSLPPLH